MLPPAICQGYKILAASKMAGRRRFMGDFSPFLPERVWFLFSVWDIMDTEKGQVRMFALQS